MMHRQYQRRTNFVPTPCQLRTNSKHIDMEQIRMRHGLDTGRGQLLC
ncbi:MULTISPECIES: hypothetical protein [Bacteroides]|nr:MULTISPECIES: hypothetical protein [Bacteroides]